MSENGDLPALEPPQRVSGMRVPEGWSLPGKPADLTPAADDAWRQSGFVLGEELRLIEGGLDLQARLAAHGYTPTARTMTMAALASLWSRALLSCSDAATLVRRGAYQSAVPLIRQAVEHVAAQSALPAELDAFYRWAHDAYGHDEGTRAEDVGLGHFFGGEAIAGDDQLRLIYRAASDLGRPNFGPTALFVANEAGQRKYPLIFADEASTSAGRNCCSVGCCASTSASSTWRCTPTSTSPPPRSCATRSSSTPTRSSACCSRRAAAASRSTPTLRAGAAT